MRSYWSSFVRWLDYQLGFNCDYEYEYEHEQTMKRARRANNSHLSA